MSDDELPSYICKECGASRAFHAFDCTIPLRCKIAQLELGREADRRRIAKLETALAFYADQARYRHDFKDIALAPVDAVAVLADRGATARSVLAGSQPAPVPLNALATEDIGAGDAVIATTDGRHWFVRRGVNPS